MPSLSYHTCADTKSYKLPLTVPEPVLLQTFDQMEGDHITGDPLNLNTALTPVATQGRIDGAVTLTDNSFVHAGQ